ncbi:hypothetical protein [Hyphomicrobium sp. D-2]|uniref:hypothetical protein n=1 Tax=Hyphomicrobium sp. D-2 TaxID=3041621 RepID=UPI002454340E|nr:hypothetical protein [Hyphomicrobium sp. D-2]MDH4981469.1 hypothetical protein [Hyphomicrobium sp. D-2]
MASIFQCRLVDVEILSFTSILDTPLRDLPGTVFAIRLFAGLDNETGLQIGPVSIYFSRAEADALASL